MYKSFYRDGCSKNIYDFQGRAIRDAFQSSIFDNIQNKLNNIDSGYVTMNIEAIRNCLNSSKHINQEELNKGWLA